VSAAPVYAFVPMTRDDLPMVQGWLARPHVAEWWGEDEGDIAEIGEALEDPDTWTFIVRMDGRPIGYAQAYDPHAWPGHHFADHPPGTRGIDQFIAEADLLGQGHGSAFVRQFCDRLIAEGAPAVVTDPHPENPRAIRAYEKAGFVLYGGPVDTDWGVSLLMARKAEDR
jgi:aminoglycoside 6'-N-acetyltransferase